MLMLLTILEAELPALSVHVPVRDWSEPSVETIWGLTGVPSTSESLSVQLKLTVTAPLFQPSPSAAGDLEPITTGGVRSMLIDPTVAEAKLPALSVQLPVTDWSAPSERSEAGLETVSAPETGSVQLKLTVTGTLFQPLALGPVNLEPVTVGAVRSILTVTETEFDVPCVLVAVHVIVVPAVSLLRIVVWHPEEEAIPLAGSETVQVTVTVLLFHPFPLGLGLMFGAMAGGGPRENIVNCVDPEAWFPDRS